MQLQRIFVGLLTLLFVVSASACNNNSGADGRTGSGGATGTGGNGSAGAGGAVGTGGSGAVSGTGGSIGGCFPALCPDGNSYGCGDCMDNDDDGLVDDKDPECLGPCDGTEGPVLLTGTPGETGNQCKADCYFDRGNGSGSGECEWNRSCDPLEPKDQCPYDPTPQICPETQPEGCEDSCGALTPNGCDCFGCCTFPELDGGYVYLGSEIGSDGTCTLADIDDPALCRPCTPAGNCLNECLRCEICLGKPTIPEDCFPGTGGSGGMGGGGGSDGGDLRCPPGKQACGLPGDPQCPASTFCLTGCCTVLVQ